MGLMSLMKKSFTGSMKLVLILGLVILSMFLINYSTKFVTFDNMENEKQETPAEDGEDEPSAEVAAPPTETPVSSSINPSDLLPSPNSGKNGWDVLEGVGTTDGANPDLLEAGHHTGIDTVGQSLRNANLQLRSDPKITLTDTGPWNQTTIDATNVQVPFNLGC